MPAECIDFFRLISASGPEQCIRFEWESLVRYFDNVDEVT
jgi:hypothetical protein